MINSSWQWREWGSILEQCGIEAGTGGVLKKRCCIKKVYLQISQKSQENICARASFLIKRLWHRCLPMDFAEFLRTYFFQNTPWRLLLGRKDEKPYRNKFWSSCLFKATKWHQVCFKIPSCFQMIRATFTT